MTTDSRKLARAIEKRLHLIPDPYMNPDPSMRADMAALCEHLIASLDGQRLLEKLHTEQVCAKHNLADEIARLQAENEAFRAGIANEIRQCAMTDEECYRCERLRGLLKDNHGKQ